MVARAGKQVSEAAAAIRGVFANPSLRRVELGWAASLTGGWTYSVAAAVFAYGEAGVTGVGVLMLVRFAPAAVAAPFAAALSDRYPRHRVLVVANLLLAAIIAAGAAVLALDAPAALVFALTALLPIVQTALQPAQAALLPGLARSPEELTAANVTSSTVESLAILAGPAVGGLLLGASSAEVVFGLAAGLMLIAAFLYGGLRTAAGEETVRPAEGRSLAAEAAEGFRAVRRHRGLTVIIALTAAQTLADGILAVLLVVVALDLVGSGPEGLGLLDSALGLGAAVGAVAAATLVGRRRLAPSFALGMVLWGLPIAVIAAAPGQGLAMAAMGVVGVGNILIDVSGQTLLQRVAPDEVLARVFGVLESFIIASIAVGGILGSALVAGLGARGALVATGLFLPAVMALGWRSLAQVDAAAAVAERPLALLRGLPIFAPLRPAILEQLASSLAPVAIAAGQEIVTQGEPGDRFYLIDQGEVEVVVDGRRVRTEGPGDHFGEIALLRDVPRTATVRAIADTDLFALDRDEFIAAVTGHAPSRAAADAVVAFRLDAARPALASF